jgi:hypothetical protein
MGDNEGCIAIVAAAGLLALVTLASSAKDRVLIVLVFVVLACGGMGIGILAAGARGSARRKRRSQLRKDIQVFLDRAAHGEKLTPEELADVQHMQREIKEIDAWFAEAEQALKRERERRRRR